MNSAGKIPLRVKIDQIDEPKIETHGKFGWARESIPGMKEKFDPNKRIVPDILINFNDVNSLINK